MDIGNLTSSYTDYLQMQSNVSTSKVENTANGLNEDSTDEELMDACKQFESYLLEQVFKEMEKTISFDDDDEGSMFGSGSSNALTDYFKDQTIAELAGSSTEQGGLGIAQMLYESMKRNSL